MLVLEGAISVYHGVIAFKGIWKMSYALLGVFSFEVGQERVSKLRTNQPCISNFQTDAPSMSSMFTCRVEQESDPEVAAAKTDSCRPKQEVSAFRWSCL